MLCSIEIKLFLIRNGGKKIKKVIISSKKKKTFLLALYMFFGHFLVF